MRLLPIFRTCAATAALLWGGLSQAALLGLTVNDPTIDAAAGGVVAYNAAAGVVTVSGSPQLLQQLDPFVFAEFGATGADDEKLISIQFRVGANGQFLGGVDGPDLIIKGSVDLDGDGVADFDGVLLEAEVADFGFEDGIAGANDKFDIRLHPTGGLLAHLYVGRDLSVAIDSEPSPDYPTPFAGSFTTDFIAQAKFVLGSVDAVVVSDPCKIKVQAYCSVAGGAFKEVCRVPVTKSPMHWEHVTHQCHGRSIRMFKYGMHGAATPAWASRYSSTPVTFKYVVKNVGTVPVSGIEVFDSFDTDPTGEPATLAPGASFTLLRTEPLREELINSVIATAASGTAMCMARDTVAVKDKVRKKRQHDDDRYTDKRARDDRDR